MNKKNQTLIILSVILLIAIFTNPGPDRHKESVRVKFNSHFQQKMSEDTNQTGDDWEKAGQALGQMLGGSFIEKMIENMVSSDNYLIFSTTKITMQNESKVIGLGVFGNVFLSKDLDKAFQGNDTSAE